MDELCPDVILVAHNSALESNALFCPLWAPGMYIVQDIYAEKH